ncbi:MAG: 1-acyl-sn-glycerol-3-phosphate acyltransferase [Treponema sp.]|nr:1-acyl-sn-glycerol-3-phosphate acyltransferase [Spirochaetia bacterium]MDD7014296.1 1-acyl-sn-glycerol-3-phosphate acyltransferase [Spirochaetales bacterium]MDY4902578.1 1-acyl-sn-glycerol-3-phosphate acyltransferase [Treponema sp.]
MNKIPLCEKYAEFFKKLSVLSTAAAKIDETNVYQPANMNTRKIMDALVEENTLPESHLEGKENFIDFYEQVKAGKSGLILMEHYSNTDLPSFCYLLEHSGDERLADLSKRIVAIAGMKLNEDSPVVRSFAESFSRVVIYPTRSLDKAEATAQNEEEAKAEEQKARKINMAAMHAMSDCKKRGEVILVFPSGTRYRPGHPETKKGLREIDSYLRLFDIVLLVSINGSILDIQDENMLHDLVGPEVTIFGAHKVIECKSFRNEYLASLPADEPDPKQKMIDHVMDLLDKQHAEIEAKK